MTRKYGRKTNVMEFEPKIREILQKVIDRKLALEWNTDGLRQNEEVFTLYRQMGGELITIGSDAHEKADICDDFDIAMQSLKAKVYPIKD